MTNIFQAMEKLSDEQIRQQLALFEVFTVTNVYKEMGYKVAKPFVKAGYIVTSWMNKQPVKTVQEFSVDEVVQHYIANRQEDGRTQLEDALKKLLREKCKLEDTVSDEALSVAVLQLASEVYQLKEELLPGEQAEGISKYYKEELATYQEEGDGEHIPPFLKYKMPLGSTKILEYLLVQLVALSVEAVGGQMLGADKGLPGWLPPRDREELRRTYEISVYECHKYQEAYEEVLQSLVACNQKIAAKNKLIEEEQNRQKSIYTSMENLNVIIQKTDTEIEKRMQKTQLKSYEAMLEISIEEVTSAEMTKKRYKEVSQGLAVKVEKALEQKEIAQEKLKHLKENNQQLREVKWGQCYKDFEFDTHCLELIGETLNEGEIMVCERVLMELHQLQDKRTLSWGDLDGAFYEMYQLTQEQQPFQHFLFSFKNEEIGICIYETMKEELTKTRILRMAKLQENQ